MSTPAPTVLGLKKSFGFGDRLGLAGPGHIASVVGTDFAPIFAQQSIREMDRTERTAEEVMTAAITAIEAANWTAPWGADADHLKTQADVQRTAAAGFRFFTIDPSTYVQNAADTMGEADLDAEVAAQNRDGIYGDTTVEDLYLGKTIEVADDFAITFEKEALYRAAVKYGRAINHCQTMASFIAEANAGRAYEIEVSVDETDSPTAHLEHLFFALELQRRGVVVVSLAPRFIGEFEKGIDYKGDYAAFEASLEKHVAISKAFGPYKISIHSGSDKFSIYPIIGRVCGDLLHVKTAGTSYLEALRCVCRTDIDLFNEVVCYSAGRFFEDKATYHISVTDEWVRSLDHNALPEGEKTFLDEDFGRQLLHVTFGSVLTKGKLASGRSFRDAVLENLETNADLHKELLASHLGKHLSQLNAG